MTDYKTDKKSDKTADKNDTAAKAKISDKNTKQEIWAAYNQLLNEIEGKPVDLTVNAPKSSADELLKSLSDLQFTLSQQLDSLADGLRHDVGSLDELRQNLTRGKRQMLEAQTEQKRLLETEMQNVRSRWQTEQADRSDELKEQGRQITQQRQRDEDEYRYNLDKKRRQEQDAYEAAHIKREAALQAREQSVTEREQAVAKLEQELAAVPERTEETVRQNRESLTKELTDKHTAELRELKLTTEHAKSVANLRIQNLEDAAKTHLTEIESLKKQLAEASGQMKDMAVSVIEARNARAAVLPDNAQA